MTCMCDTELFRNHKTNSCEHGKERYNGIHKLRYMNIYMTKDL